MPIFQILCFYRYTFQTFFYFIGYFGVFGSFSCLAAIDIRVYITHNSITNLFFTMVKSFTKKMIVYQGKFYKSVIPKIQRMDK